MVLPLVINELIILWRGRTFVFDHGKTHYDSDNYGHWNDSLQFSLWAQPKSVASQGPSNVEHSLFFEHWNVRCSNVRQYLNVWMLECSLIFFSHPCSRVRMFAEHERTFEHWIENVHCSVTPAASISLYQIVFNWHPCHWNFIVFFVKFYSDHTLFFSIIYFSLAKYTSFNSTHRWFYLITYIAYTV